MFFFSIKLWVSWQFDDWRMWIFIESRLNFQLLNFKSHFEQIIRFFVFDSKQNSTTTRFSKIKLICDHFVKMIKRCSYAIDDVIVDVFLSFSVWINKQSFIFMWICKESSSINQSHHFAWHFKHLMIFLNVRFMIKSHRDDVNCWKLVVKSLFESD